MSAGQIPEKQMIPGVHIKEDSGSTYKIRGGTFNHEETRFTGGGALHDSSDGDCMRIKTYTDTGNRSRDNDRTPQGWMARNTKPVPLAEKGWAITI